jgi:hypothetical protein
LVWTDKYPINDDVRCPFYLLFIFERRGNTAVAFIPLVQAGCSKPQIMQSARFSFRSSELGPPTPLPARECCSSPPPPLGQGARHTRLLGRGAGGPNSDEGTVTLVLYVYYKPSIRSKLFTTEHSGKTFAIFEQDKFIFYVYVKNSKINLRNYTKQVIIVLNRHKPFSLHN